MLGGLVSYRYTDGRTKPPKGYVVTMSPERVKEMLDADAPIEVVEGHALVGLKVKKPKKPEPKPETEGAPEPEEVTAPDGDDRDGWPDGYTHSQHGAYDAVSHPSGAFVLSDSPSGKFKGLDAAQEAAWRHKEAQG